jgi:hypothetical protein
MNTLRFAFMMLSFVGTFMGVLVVMISALLHLNEASPIDPIGNSMLIICAVIAAFFISVTTINNINNLISKK